MWKNNSKQHRTHLNFSESLFCEAGGLEHTYSSHGCVPRELLESESRLDK